MRVLDRSSQVRLILAMALVCALGAAPPTRATAARLTTPEPAHAPDPYVDPAMMEQLGAGMVPAIFAYDPATVSRREMVAALKEREISGHLFERAPVGYGCAGSAQTVRALASIPGVRSLFANAELTPTLDKSVPTTFGGSPSSIWQDLGLRGSGVGIAVIDTGIDGSHPDVRFGTRVKQNIRVLFSHKDLQESVDPCPYVNIYSDPMEDTEITSGHGTHMASIAAGDGTASDGKYTGVAPEANIIGVAISDTFTPRVHLDKDVTGSNRDDALTLLGAIAGLDWVMTYSIDAPGVMAKVALLAWSHEERYLYHPTLHPLSTTIETAGTLGLSVVVPAGNGGPDVSDCTVAETCHFNPLGVGEYPITVGGAVNGSRRVLANYSSRGDPRELPFGDSTVRYEPTLVAPGGGVVAARHLGLAPFVTAPGPLFLPPGASGGKGLSTDPDYVSLAGTSVAAAHVAGTIALMQEASMVSHSCHLTVLQVKDILRQTATPMPGYQRWEVGAGMIDATAAVRYARFWPEDVFLC